MSSSRDELSSEKALARIRRLRIIAILRWLKKQSFADRVLVVGSVAHGKPDPGDLDIVVDVQSVTTDNELWKIGSRLLYVARLPKYYGLFDPFLLLSNGLWVRNDEATDWEKSKLCKKDLLDGAIPLLEFEEPPWLEHR